MADPLSSRSAPIAGIKVVSHLGADVFRLERLRFADELGRPFRLDLDLVTDDAGISPDRMLGQEIAVTLPLPAGGERHFHGFVRHFARVIAAGRSVCRCTVVPWIDLLSLGADFRIFQQKSPLEIVTGVFFDLGFSDHDSAGISGSYPTLDFCVQYGDSHLDFVHRLLERFGIAYYVDHSKGSHQLRLVDSPDAHTPLPGAGPIPFLAVREAAAAVEHIFAWESSGAMQPGRHTVKDYDYEDPKNTLLHTEDAGLGYPHGDMEWFAYPGGCLKGQEPKAAARRRADAAGCHGMEAAGEAHSLGIAVGHTFQFQGCPVSSENGTYLATAVELVVEPPEDGGAGGDGAFVSRCRFRAIRQGVTFRPRRLTPAPRVHGVQPAVVVGPQGQDPKTPYTDKLGRIKVQFHWDRRGSGTIDSPKYDDKASCWLRTPHQSAGNGYGHVWLPRIGCEVLVAFVDGDPDRPVIVGHVYNGQTTLPLDLPAEARVGIVKDDGGNYMRIDPTDGGQVMAMFSPTEKTSLKLGKT